MKPCARIAAILSPEGIAIDLPELPRDGHASRRAS
jgi:hypothetical protein